MAYVSNIYYGVDDRPCEVCEKPVICCECPECAKCGWSGDPKCTINKGEGCD